MDWRYFPQNRVELLIAALRAIFASFSLWAIWLDPSGSYYASHTYHAMLYYVTYSLAVAAVAWRVPYPLKWFGLITHGVDLAIFTVFMFFTEGPSSPFSAYFVFIVICGTLRWHWRGALFTAMIALSAYLGLGYNAQYIIANTQFGLQRFIIQSIYLTIVAILLAYMGAHQHKKETEITMLAHWPTSDLDDFRSLMRRVLKHSCDVLDVQRALAIWQEPEEPWLNIASYSNDEFQLTREGPEAFGEIITEPLSGTDFFCFNAAAPETVSLYASPQGFSYRRQLNTFNRDLRSRYDIRSVLSLNLDGERLNGHLLMLDKSKMTSDDLVMGKIVAHRISMILDQFYLLEELRQAAVVEERIRLARDLHDGLLQSLAGIGIKIHTVNLLVEREPAVARKELLEIKELLTYEQRDLRCLIHELKPLGSNGNGTEASFRNRLNDLAGLIENYWGLQVEMHIPNLGSTFPVIVEQEIYFLLREGLVNCAKHAAASKARVEMQLTNKYINLIISDDGRGFPYLGRYDFQALCSMQLGPTTIKERITASGGDLTLDSSSSGTCLTMSLPIKAKWGFR